MLHYLYELAFFFLGWKFIERVQTYDQLKKVAQFFLILIFFLKQINGISNINISNKFVKSNKVNCVLATHGLVT